MLFNLLQHNKDTYLDTQHVTLQDQ